MYLLHTPLHQLADGVVYAVGTNSFVINWTITDGTTTTGDYSAASGTVTITEYKGGGAANESTISTSTLWRERDISLIMTDDDVDEPAHLHHHQSLSMKYHAPAKVLRY